MKRIFSLVPDNAPKMSRFSVTILEGETRYLLQTDGLPVSWAMVTHTNVINGGDAYVIKKGRQVIGYNPLPESAVDSVSVVYADGNFADTNYTITTTISNTVDIEPSIYSTTIEDKSVSGFSVILSGITDSANYVLNWMAISETPGDHPITGSGSGDVGEIDIVDGQLYVLLSGFTTGENVVLDVIYR